MTTTPTPTTELVIPGDAVPPAVRTVAYYVALVVGAVATGTTAVAAAVVPENAATVAAVAGAVSGVVATIAGGLGVVYRPTALPAAIVTPVEAPSALAVGDVVRVAALVNTRRQGEVGDIVAIHPASATLATTYDVRFPDGAGLFTAAELVRVDDLT